MTIGRPDLLEAADAELLAQARAGDDDAFGVLYERHVAAARRLAYQLAPTPRQADDVVSEAFGRILTVVSRGGGPATAFRPYALTAVRRVAGDRFRPARDQPADDAESLPDPDRLLVDPAFAGLETSLIARAYQSLPERSRAVLWHTEIEHDPPADVAPLLGLTRNGVAALRRRAADDLRHAYLQMHVSLITQPGCRPVAERLGAYGGRSLSARDAALVSEHLARCEGCQVVHRELTDIMASVRGVVAPLVLGTAAAAYLAEAAEQGLNATGGSRREAAPAGQSARTGLDILGGASAGSLSQAWRPPDTETASRLLPETAALARPDELGRPTRAHRRRLSRSQRVAAAVTAGVVLAGIAGVALAVSLSGNGNTPASASQRPPVPSVHAAATQPSSAESPSLSPSPQPSPSASPIAAVPPAAPVTLTVSVTTSGSSQFQNLSFTVTNTGSAVSGPLTVVISLPAGATLGGHGGDQANGTPEGIAQPLSRGWSCQPTGGGATCTHAAIGAGQQAQTWLSVNAAAGSSLCAQSVDLTVSGGSATVTASHTFGC